MPFDPHSPPFASQVRPKLMPAEFDRTQAALQATTALAESTATVADTAATGLAAKVAKGELVYSASDSASLSAAITATPAGSTIYLKGATTYALGSITSHNKDLTVIGDGPRSSVIDLGSTAFGFASGGTGTGARLTFRGVGFIGSTSAIFQLNRLYHYSVRFIDCRFSGFAASGIQTFGTNLTLVRCEFSTAGTPGTSDAIVCNRGAQSIHVEDCTFKYLRRGIYATNTNGPVTNLVVTGCTFDGGWMYLKSTASNSGGTVTYSATTVTDTAASFPAFTVNDTIRALAAKRTGTITTISNNEITDSAANFTTAGVLVGDIFRTATAWGVVQEVVSTTLLRIEEWIDSTTYEPTPPQTTTTAYTVYGLVLGRVVSNTATVVTVDAWRNWNGTIATPASGTLYERAPKADYQGVFCASGKKIRVTNNTIRRTWSDSVSLQADQELIVTNNNIYDSQDVGITVGMPTTTQFTNNFVITNNVLTHIGSAGIWLGANFDGEVIGNVIVEPNWISLSTTTYAGIVVAHTNRTNISHNVLRRVNHPSALIAIKLLHDGSANPVIDEITMIGNRISGYESLTDIQLTGASGNITNVTGLFHKNARLVVTGGCAPPAGQFFGTGTPESVVPAGVGSTYRRLDGGAGTCLYVKESGTAATGWIAK